MVCAWKAVTFLRCFYWIPDRHYGHIFQNLSKNYKVFWKKYDSNASQKCNCLLTKYSFITISKPKGLSLVYFSGHRYFCKLDRKKLHNSFWTKIGNFDHNDTRRDWQHSLSDQLCYHNKTNCLGLRPDKYTYYRVIPLIFSTVQQSYFSNIKFMN